MDIIGIVISVEDDDYQGKAFKRVTLGTGDVLKVKYGREGALKAKWGLLKEGVAMKFIMKDFTTVENVKIPYVFDIATVEGELPDPVPTKTTGSIDEPRDDTPVPAPPPPPQAVGMCVKELGDMIRSKYLKPIFGDVVSIALTKWYRYQVLGITRIDFKGSDLPSFEKKEE